MLFQLPDLKREQWLIRTNTFFILHLLMVNNDFHTFHIWNEHCTGSRLIKWFKKKKYTFQQWSPEWLFIVKRSFVNTIKH